jgi:hypothetical protein
MIQQINLYQSDASDDSPLASPYVLGLAGLVVVMVLSSVGLAISTYWKQSELDDLHRQLELIKSGVLQEQALHANIPDSSLETQLAETQQQYQSLAKTLATLADSQSDADVGFSKYLLALAQQSDGQVWTSRLQVDAQNDYIRLEGSAARPDQIALLLGRIQNTSAFKGRHFSRLSVEQSDDAGVQLNFSVESGQPPAEKEVADANNH